jgi:hypothetical protein
VTGGPKIFFNTITGGRTLNSRSIGFVLLLAYVDIASIGVEFLHTRVSGVWLWSPIIGFCSIAYVLYICIEYANDTS